MSDSAKKILIIEDEKPIARALELKLSHEGFSPVVISSGVSGVEMMEKDSFDVVILDLVMPKVDGFEVLKRMREKKITTPVIVLSNLSQEEDKDKVLELGAKEFFIKSNMPIAEVVEYVKKLSS